MMPALPSEPVPESTMAMAFSPQALASERKKELIGRLSTFSPLRSVLISSSPSITMSFFGGSR